MRLIDADKLERDLESLKQDYEDEGCDSKRIDGIDDCIEEIGYTEPIDAEPVIHAHWEKADSRFHRRLMQCSNCGNFLDMEGVNCGRGSANYCPNCGAKMDS